MERQVGVGEGAVLGPHSLADDQLADVGQIELLVETRQVGLDLAYLHQVDTGQQHTVDVEQQLDLQGTRRLHEPPLRGGEAKIMMAVVPRDAVTSDGLELIALWHGVDHERRVKLLQDVAVSAEQQRKEFTSVVCDQINLYPVSDMRGFESFWTLVESDYLVCGQQVHAAEVVVRV